MARYLKKDCELGYVEDSAEINYLKFNNLRHTILGCMLGDFDENGNYVVSPEIRNELIEMKKYVYETMENIEICHSELKLDRQISFIVTYEANRATLSLIEKINYEGNFKINSGAYSNINEYLLDEVETSGVINKNAIYQRWNISEFGGNVLDIFSCDEALLEKYFGIINRFKYLLLANKVLLDNEEKVEELESAYTNKVLKLISQFSELKKLVDESISASMKERVGILDPNKPNFAKTLNEVIDKTIEDNLSLLSEEKRLDFAQQMHTIKNETNIKREDLLTSRPQEIEADIAAISNSEEQDLSIETVRISRLNTEHQEDYLSVLKCGEEFARANREYQARKSAKEKQGSETERDLLIAYLISKGLIKTPEKQVAAQPSVAPAPVAPAASPAPAKPASKSDGKSAGKSSGGGGGSKGGSSSAKKKPANLVQKAGQREETTAEKTKEQVALERWVRNSSTRTMHVSTGTARQETREEIRNALEALDVDMTTAQLAQFERDADKKTREVSGDGMVSETTDKSLEDLVSVDETSGVNI